MAWARDFLTSGVIQGIGTALAVVQRGAGANMSVDVGIGRALYQITTTLLAPNETYKIIHDSDAVVNVPISTADPTNPRIDIIVMKFDVSVLPDSAAANNASIIVVAGTPAGSPSAPATPANCLLLAQVAVAAGAASIVNANITDKRAYVEVNTANLVGLYRVADGQKDVPNWLGTITGTNTLTGTASPAPAAYAAGMRFEFIAAANNTGVVTLNVNGLGAKTIKRLDGATDLVSGDIKTGQLVGVKYDGTNFQMYTPSGNPPPTVTYYTKILDSVVKHVSGGVHQDSISNTAVETAFASSIPYAANAFAAQGDEIMLRGFGSIRTKASGPGTLTLNLYKDSTLLGALAVITLSAGVDYQQIDFSARVIADAVGAGGKVYVIGDMYCAASSTTQYKLRNYDTRDTNRSIALDTTVGGNFYLKAQFSVGDVANYMDLSSFTGERKSKTAFT